MQMQSSRLRCLKRSLECMPPRTGTCLWCSNRLLRVLPTELPTTRVRSIQLSFCTSVVVKIEDIASFFFSVSKLYKLEDIHCWCLTCCFWRRRFLTCARIVLSGCTLVTFCFFFLGGFLLTLHHSPKLLLALHLPKVLGRTCCSCTRWGGCRSIPFTTVSLCCGEVDAFGLATIRQGHGFEAHNPHANPACGQTETFL